jgi:hypothetical protein
VTSSERAPRWDPDERGTGVADASAHLATLDALREAAARPDWVAEEPEAHLLPHLRSAVAADGATLAIDAATTDPDGTFVVEARWIGDAEDARAARVAALALVATVVESTTAIHLRHAADADVYEIVTGELPGDSTFATHGHTLRLRVVGAPRPGQ